MQQAAIITGASDGIGRALALELARRRIKVGLIARREEKLREVSDECRKAGAPAAELAALDVTDTAALRTALADLDRRLGGATIFVANAGIDLDAKVREDRGDAAKRIFDVNISAAVAGIEWMKARFIERGRGGRLAGIGSVAAARGLPTAGPYCASKAALHSYLEALRAEMRPHRIRVTTVAPGFIDTAMTRDNEVRMPFLMPVERAAPIFARAILAGRNKIIAPWQWIPIFWLLRAMPDFLYDFLVTLGRPSKS
jgi:hypothetical protein